MKIINKQIEAYQEKIKHLAYIGDNSFTGYSKDAIRTEINIYRDFIKVLETINKTVEKTETPDSILLDQFEDVTQKRDDILMSYDHEDGYFVSIVDRGYNHGEVADNDTSQKRFNIRDAIQAAIDYKRVPTRFR